MEQINTKKIPLITSRPRLKQLAPYFLVLLLVIIIPVLIFAAKTVQDIRNRAYESTSISTPIVSGAASCVSLDLFRDDPRNQANKYYLENRLSQSTRLSPGNQFVAYFRSRTLSQPSLGPVTWYIGFPMEYLEVADTDTGVNWSTDHNQFIYEKPIIQPDTNYGFAVRFRVKKFTDNNQLTANIRADITTNGTFYPNTNCFTNVPLTPAGNQEICRLDDPSSCPTGYSCQRAPVGGSQTTVVRCVPNQTPTPTSGCTIKPNSCPTGYTCLQTTIGTPCVGANCGPQQVTTKCVPSSQTPTPTAARRCTIGQPNTCPSGYICKQPTPPPCTKKPCPSYMPGLATCVRTSSTPTPAAGCKIAGCSGELCVSSDSDDRASVCLWKEEYSCLKYAKCQKLQSTGKCGWAQTDTYKRCIANIVTPTPTATVTGTDESQRADINKDGIVDISDYSLLVSDFLKSGSDLPADINLDGIVDISDYSLLVKYFLQTL